MKLLFSVAATLLLALPVAAQKVEEGLDAYFKPTTGAPRYYAITEKKDTLYHRQTYYLPERSLAMEGGYKDKDCSIPHGMFTWYHNSRFPKEKGAYHNGIKQGMWLRYNEDGIMKDSMWYEGGRLKGVGMGWYADGMPADSSNFDGSGNGVRVYWHQSGALSAAGRIINDTAKQGRWQYFHENGKIKATEDYLAGERKTISCFDEQGVLLDSAICSERDAEFQGGESGWKLFVQRNLKPEVPLNKKAPVGQYTVMLQFIVETDGSLSNLKPLTRFGFGMEEEVIRMLKKSPRWVPAQQFGKKVKAYRIQPVTFVISEG